VRSRPGAARTILLFHIITARPSKQPRMVGSTLGVHSFGLIFVSARTNKRHHHHIWLYGQLPLIAIGRALKAWPLSLLHDVEVDSFDDDGKVRFNESYYSKKMRLRTCWQE
jgi:hypothetical protein